MEVQERRADTPGTYICPDCKQPKTVGNFWHSQPFKKDGTPRVCRRCELGLGKHYGGKPSKPVVVFRAGEPLDLGGDVLYEAFPNVQKVRLKDWLELGEKPSAFYVDGMVFIQDYRGGELCIRILTPSGKLKDGAAVPKQWILGDELVHFTLTRLCDLSTYGLVFY
jgi:hypothetical protein